MGYLEHVQPASPPQHAPSQGQLSQTHVPEVSQPQVQFAHPPFAQHEPLLVAEATATVDTAHALLAAQQSDLDDSDGTATFESFEQHVHLQMSHVQLPVSQQPQHEHDEPQEHDVALALGMATAAASPRARTEKIPTAILCI